MTVRARLVRLAFAAALLVAGCAPAVGSSLSPSTSAAPSSAVLSASTPASSVSPSSSVSPASASLPPLPTTALGGNQADAMQAALESAVRGGAPDAIAAVVTERGTWAGAAGIGGPNGRKATAADEFAIASLTKTFTAALIMRLAEQGRIDLDAPLATYLGDLKVDTNGATVRQTLEMRAGLADHPPDIVDRIHADASKVWTAADRVAGYQPPLAEPGTYTYSSPSYELLAIAAEHVTGTSFGAALRAELLDPVGADRILDQMGGGVTPQPWAVPIDHHLGTWKATDMGAGGALSCISSATSGTGAGSMASDAPSLARWLWHLFAGDILEPSTIDGMLAAGRKSWAYGLDAAPYMEANSVANSGNKTGYGSQWVYFPSSRVVVVIFVNDQDFEVEPTVNRLLQAALQP